MELIEAFSKGKVEGIEPILDVIDTQLSKIFIGKNKAYKVYLKQNTFFADLKNPEYRKKFYKEDFSWNYSMSPEVYLELKSVAFKGDKFIVVKEEESEDYFIEMNLVDTNCNLSQLLLDNKVTKDNIKLLVNTMERKLSSLTKEKKAGLSNISNSWSYLYGLRIKDLEEFVLSQSAIQASLLKEAFMVLKNHHESSEYFKKYPEEELSVAIDGHSDNILFLDNKVSFIDVLLVADRWRLTDPYFEICRLVVDIETLGEPELVTTFYDSLQKKIKNLPEDIHISYKLSSAILKGAYNSIIGKEDLAIKYVPLIKNLTSSLKSKGDNN